MAKQGLVVGHLEGLSGRVLELYPAALRQLIKGKSGVYALYKQDSLYYVGLAGNLMGRVNTHLKDRHKGRWNRFSVYLTTHDEHIKELESLLLRIVSPKGNLQSGKLPGSADYFRAIKRLMRADDEDRRANLLGGKEINRRVKSRGQKRGGARTLANVLGNRTPLRGYYKGKTYRGTLKRDGTVSYRGKVFASLSAAAQAIRKSGTNGWAFWHYRDKDSDWVPLKTRRT